MLKRRDHLRFSVGATVSSELDEFIGKQCPERRWRSAYLRPKQLLFELAYVVLKRLRSAHGAP